MPVHGYVVIIVFIVFLFIFLVQYFRIKRDGSEFMGEPSIEKRYFMAGKIALYSTWVMFILKAIHPGIGYILLPEPVSWIATGILIGGVLIVTVSFLYLGRSLKVGLPVGETRLQVHGIYRVSRNPLYIGVYMISMASCLYFPDLVNIVFTIFGIYMHHLIIRQEERFLADRFGTEWLIYSARVSRYL